METILYAYTPTENTDTWYIWAGLSIALIGFGLTYYFLNKKEKGRKHTMNALIAMLFFIMGLLGTTTSFFSAWSVKKIGHVHIFADHLEIGSQYIGYKSIRKIFFKEEKNTSIMTKPGSEKSDYFLVIESNNRAVYVIPGQSYPIGEIKTQIEALRIKDVGK